VKEGADIIGFTEDDDGNAINTIGIIEALKPGTATLVATTDDGSYTAEAVITVIAGPTATIRNGRTAGYSIMGATTRDRVVWTLKDSVGATTSTNVTGTTQVFPTPPGAGVGSFDAVMRGVSVRMTAKTTGTNVIVLTGEVKVPDPADPDDRDKDITVREQSWILASVNPIARIELHGNATLTDPPPTNALPETLVRRVVLNVDREKSDGVFINGDSATLSAIITRPDDATRLDYDWASSVDRRNVPEGDKREFLDITSSGDTNNIVTIKAQRPGNARLTGTNFNGRRRVNLSVRVMINPLATEIVPRQGISQVKVGRTVSVRGRVNGDSNLARIGRVNPALTYSIAGVTTNSDGIAANAVVSLDTRRQRLTAVGPGTVTLEITGTGGAKQEVTITVAE
jgi:hypothetical protein